MNYKQKLLSGKYEWVIVLVVFWVLWVLLAFWLMDRGDNTPDYSVPSYERECFYSASGDCV